MEVYYSLFFILTIDLVLCVTLGLTYKELKYRFLMFALLGMACELTRQGLNLAITGVSQAYVLYFASGGFYLARGLFFLASSGHLTGKHIRSRWYITALATYGLISLAIRLVPASDAFAWQLASMPSIAVNLAACYCFAGRGMVNSFGKAWLLGLMMVTALFQALIAGIVTVSLPLFGLFYFMDSVVLALMGMAFGLIALEELQLTYRRAQEEIAQSAERFQWTFDSASDAIVTFDVDGNITSWNRESERMFGWKAGEAVKKRFAQTVLQRNWGEEVRDQIRDYLATEEPQFLCTRTEMVALRRNGDSFPVELTIAPMCQGKNWTFSAFMRDLTEIKRAEHERDEMESQIQHTQKLESLGILAAGIAHDFNNLLVGILGFANLARKKSSPGSPERKHIQEIELAAERAANLTNQMLAYSGKGAAAFRPIDISSVVTEMKILLRTSISKKAKFITDLDGNHARIEGDPGQIGQVVMNLMINASDALGNRPGEIIIRTGVTCLDDEVQSKTYLREDLPEGPYAFIEVSDTGCGLDEKAYSKLFDPFYTTKATGRGLGLSAVLGIVRAHKGAICIDSTPGKGTTFLVLFPRTLAPVIPQATLLADASPSLDWRPNDPGTVLVVDDEEIVRNLTMEILENVGFKVVLAASGADAIEAIEKTNEKVVLVILDLIMSDLDGRETAVEIRKFDARVPILLSSGYVESDATEGFEGLNLAGYIKKPYGEDALLSKVRMALTAGAQNN